MIALVNRWYSTLGLLFVLGNLPLLWAALRALSERDYAAGGLLVFAAASTGHLGLELLALGRRGSDEVAP
jgi:hypothetical protein